MSPASPPEHTLNRHWLWALFAGIFVAIAILKFSTPPILDDQVEAPKTGIEWLFFSWPNMVGQALLAGLCLSSVRSIRRHNAAPSWLLLLPGIWLGWQILCTANTIHLGLTRATLAHFTSLVLLFYLGYFALSRQGDLRGFRGPVLIGFVFVLWSGLEQRFGGLQATREMIYAQPNWQELPPEYLEKIAKDRIFSTLFYPNAFAGGILLLTPLCAVSVWLASARLQTPSRIVIVGTFALTALACLYWTESKSGWLVCLVLGVVFALLSSLAKQIKITALAILLIGGLAGFFWKYADYFDKGATSVTARFDYWQAAWSTAKANPLFGSGPGTFMKAYAKIKPPEAEMARLAHNDYLQQASDSGFLGAFLYATFIGAALYYSWRRVPIGPLQGAVWYGLLGFAIQSFVEFGLHIPALSWSFFLLLGWLLGQKASTAKSSSPL